jgi:hypothetical protein
MLVALVVRQRNPGIPKRRSAEQLSGLEPGDFEADLAQTLTKGVPL